MKRKWTTVILILAVIGGITGLAQFSSLRKVSDSIFTFAFTPRMNGQYFKIDANTSKAIPFLIEPGYQSYLVVSGKSPVSYRLLNDTNTEVQPGPETYNVTETLKNGFYAKTFRFTANTSTTGSEMWTAEITAGVETTISFLNGNESASDRGIAVAIEKGMPERNEVSKVFVIAHNFDDSKNKVELRKSQKASDPGVAVEIRDDGIYPDEVANDHRFTGIASTQTLGSYGMVATLFQKTFFGQYASVQTSFESYTVYENTMRVVDAPQAKLLFHELYGVAVGVELTFDIDVVTPGKYGISTTIFGKDSTGREVSTQGTNMIENQNMPNTAPFYAAGRHRITTTQGFDPEDVGWLSGAVNVEFRTSDDENNRDIEIFTSQTPLIFPRDQLVRKRFQSYDGDRLVDTNGDGDLDAMEVRFSANAYKAGNYVWGADIELSKDAQLVGSFPNSGGVGGRGPLGIGLHHFTLVVPLDNFWDSKAKGTFDVAVGLVIPDSGDTIRPLKPENRVFKSQRYDLTFGQAEAPKTFASLIQAIKDAKTLRPADAIKAEILAKIEEAQVNGAAGKEVEARIAMNTVGELIQGATDFFSERTIRYLHDIYDGPQTAFQNGIFK